MLAFLVWSRLANSKGYSEPRHVWGALWTADPFETCESCQVGMRCSCSLLDSFLKINNDITTSFPTRGWTCTRYHLRLTWHTYISLLVPAHLQLLWLNNSANSSFHRLCRHLVCANICRICWSIAVEWLDVGYSPGPCWNVLTMQRLLFFCYLWAEIAVLPETRHIWGHPLSKHPLNWAWSSLLLWRVLPAYNSG